MSLKSIWKKIRPHTATTWSHLKVGANHLRSMEDKGLWEQIDVGLNLVDLGKSWWKQVRPVPVIDTYYASFEFLGYEEFAAFIDQTLISLGIGWEESGGNDEKNETTDPNVRKLRTVDFTLYHTLDGVYLDGKAEVFGNWLKGKLLEQFGKNMTLNCDTWEFGTDKIELRDSRMLDHLYDRACKYMKIGEGWSLLLHGPPGTGKSTLARGLGVKMGSSLMLRELESLAENEGVRSVVLKVLDILEVEVIILEDMDHCEFAWTSLLKFLEELQLRKKVLVGTANVIKKFNSAVTRPGRFDQVMEINRLDEKTVMEMVEGDKQLFDLIKDFPVACVRELMRRVRALGKEEALTEIDDIIERGKVKGDAQDLEIKISKDEDEEDEE